MTGSLTISSSFSHFRDCQLLGDPQFPGGVELLEPGDISDESLSKWPPTGEKKNSLRKGMYTSFNKDIFQVSRVDINVNVQLH